MAQSPGVIVDATWVGAHLDEITLVDVRWYLDGRDGHAAFEAAHLPGATYLDLDRELSARDKGGVAGRHPLPTPEAFASSLGRHGIGADDVVVAYDDSGGGTAGRLVWMLRALGQPAALLDGGLHAWTGPVETGPTADRLRVFVHPRPWPPALLVDADEVARVGGSSGAEGVVLDARAPERYRGEAEPVDPRAGHIPGARNAPWADNLGPDGRFLGPDALQARYRTLGVEPGRAIAYCGSGVSACADLLAIEHAGLGPARLFVPSWSGWSSDPGRAVATGDGQ